MFKRFLTVSVSLGNEIENIEVMFTDQGLLVYKIYSNGHPYDTSLVWASMFKTLIESNYIPAIIIPKGFPNPRTFALINTYIQEEYMSSVVTYRDDYFDDMRSYYDFRPEKIKEGDILINEDNIYLLKLPDIHSYYCKCLLG